MVDLTTWTLSRDVFFINCSRRKFRRDGYLCVKEGLESGSLSVSCVPSLKEHNDLDTFMLFRLLPSSVSTQGHDSPTSKTAVKEINLNKDEEDEVEAAERRRKETARVFTATVDFHTDRCVEQPSLTALSD